ncbi:MAG: hypothetical protein ACOYOB_18240, partial [Myxococcota bacterium]
TRPALDVAALAQQQTPVGRVAHRLIELQAGRADDLVGQASRKVGQLSSGRWEAAVDAAVERDSRKDLEAACWRTLEVLVEQRNQEVR